MQVIVPAHNEEATIGAVVQALAPVAQVIVVADRCSDRTAELAAAAGASLVFRGLFGGKGQAMAAGLTKVLGPRVAFCDADLVGLTPDVAARFVLGTGHTIGLLDNSRGAPLGAVSLSGERSLPTTVARSVVLHGWGAEMALNAACSGAKVPLHYVSLPGVEHRLKAQKGHSRLAYLGEAAEVAATFLNTLPLRLGGS